MPGRRARSWTLGRSAADRLLAFYPNPRSPRYLISSATTPDPVAESAGRSGGGAGVPPMTPAPEYSFAPVSARLHVSAAAS